MPYVYVYHKIVLYIGKRIVAGRGIEKRKIQVVVLSLEYPGYYLLYHVEYYPDVDDQVSYHFLQGHPMNLQIDEFIFSTINTTKSHLFSNLTILTSDKNWTMSGLLHHFSVIRQDGVVASKDGEHRQSLGAETGQGLLRDTAKITRKRSTFGKELHEILKYHHVLENHL